MIKIEQNNSTQNAYTELNNLKTTNAAYAFGSIKFIEQTIRKDFAASGTKVSQKLDDEIKQAVMHAHRVTADHDWKNFKTTNTAYDSGSIKFIEQTIRKDFAASGTKVSQKLDDEIKQAVMHAHRVTADHDWKNFKTTNTAYDSGSIKFIEQTIRENCAAGGVTIDENFDKEIKQAVARAHGVSAEKGLSNFETTTAAYGAGGIKHIDETIRQHFVANGTEVTATGKLPDPIEARLNAATARARKLSGLHAA